mmetsp:Transcript_47246/g.102875  ORF Transcript_47246/g.102875 Transcript_47246/m.102875 type:complete len:267 (-) Transcript_47246:12-812(-)
MNEPNINYRMDGTQKVITSSWADGKWATVTQSEDTTADTSTPSVAMTRLLTVVPKHDKVSVFRQEESMASLSNQLIFRESDWRSVQSDIAQGASIVEIHKKLLLNPAEEEKLRIQQQREAEERRRRAAEAGQGPRRPDEEHTLRLTMKPWMRSSSMPRCMSASSESLHGRSPVRKRPVSSATLVRASPQTPIGLLRDVDPRVVKWRRQADQNLPAARPRSRIEPVRFASMPSRQDKFSELTNLLRAGTADKIQMLPRRNDLIAFCT